MSSNSSYAGVWNYSITVTDNDTQTDSQIFISMFMGMLHWNLLTWILVLI